MRKPCVYIIECADGTYYTGVTTDLPTRLAQHELGHGHGFAQMRRPFKLVYSQEFATITEANSAERRLKGWSRAKKEALIRGDFDSLHVLSQCRNQSHSKNK